MKRQNHAILFVSQTLGDDSATGYLPADDGRGNGPLKTMEAALERIRALRREEHFAPMTVALTEDYFLQAPIDIRDTDAVTVTSYGARRRVIGGARIAGWRHGEFNGSPCLCATLPDGVPADVTDLFVNGERAHATRFPKGRNLKIRDAENALRGPHQHGEYFWNSSRWFLVDPADLAEAKNIENALINYDHYWVDEHSPIESYDPKTGMLVMTCHSRFSISVSYDENPQSAPLYYLTNVPNTFGEANEWYLDRATRTVYYVPRGKEITPDTIEAFVPLTDRLFCISGKDVYLENLELTCTRGDYLSTAQHPINVPPARFYASDVQSVHGAPGAILFTDATRCGMLSCSLHGVGIYAVDLRQRCDRIRIEGNHIYDVAAGGIRIAGGKLEEDPSYIVSHCAIQKNHIHACGKRYLAGCGILLMDASDCDICENEIHDLEYSGISAGWVWGYTDSKTYGCRIHKNHIYDIGKGNLSDMGGIYLLGKQPGTVVSENVIHDVRCHNYGAWGIYLDEGSSFITVKDNLIYRTQSECFHLHYGSHNTVKNNVFLGNAGSCVRISREESHPQVRFEDNLFVTDGVPIYGRLLLPPKNLTTDRNLLWDRKNAAPVLWASSAGERTSLATWQRELENDVHSRVLTSADLPAILAQFDRWELTELLAQS